MIGVPGAVPPVGVDVAATLIAVVNWMPGKFIGKPPFCTGGIPTDMAGVVLPTVMPPD